ncbi:MAG: hypothetical protein ACTSW1_08450 [Candidatus Hodarchaeales archaeon]
MCKRDSQVTVKIPNYIELRYNSPSRERRSSVSIDSCIVDAIEGLWREGVRTQGCCCGHGPIPATVCVEDEDIPKMKAMGAKVFQELSRYGWTETNEDGSPREDIFYLEKGVSDG